MSQRRTLGAVHAVPLGDGTNGYALTLPEADFAFFDKRASDHPKLDEFLSTPILFRVAVHKSAWVSGRWPKIGKISIPSSLTAPVPTFIQNSVKPDQYEIYLAGAIRPATKEECEGLERCAVWEPNHVEDRLRDHYAGKANVWVDSLQLK